MGYDPVRKSEASRGEIAPQPQSGQVQGTHIEDREGEFYMIEWDIGGLDCWIVANSDAYISLDRRM